MRIVNIFLEVIHHIMEKRRKKLTHVSNSSGHKPIKSVPDQQEKDKEQHYLNKPHLNFSHK